MWHYLSVHPLATISALGFYALLIALAFPETREKWMPLPKRTVGAKKQHLAGFDAYRGLAAVFVALGHMLYFGYPVFVETGNAFGPLSRGAAAVPIFCVLSGFLISRSAATIKTVDDLRSYAIRRIFRIWPVYVVGVLLCALMGVYGYAENPIRAFFADFFMFRMLWWANFSNPVAWSLYHELTFYALMPIIFAIAGREKLALFAVLGIIAMVLADDQSRDFGVWRFFLIGILASEISPRIPAPWALPTFAAGCVAAAYYLVAPQDLADVPALIGLTVPRGDEASLFLGMACLLVFASTPHLVFVGRILETYPLRLIGMISYSLYVTHLFFLQANFPEWAKLVNNAEFFSQYEQLPWWYLPVLFLPGMMFWATVCYFVVEKRGIEIGNRLSRRLPIWSRKQSMSAEETTV